MKIAGHEVGPGRPTFVVAEVGPNHEGRIEQALWLVDAAKEAGADAVKFQLYRPEDLTAERDDWRVTGGPWNGLTLWELYRRAQTPAAWLPDLFAHAREVGIIPFASAFAPWAVEALEAVDCPAYKVASLEIGELDLIQRMGRTGKPIILSTGRASEAQIDQALKAVSMLPEFWDNAAERTMRLRNDPTPLGEREGGIALLHCLAAYPTAARDMRLHTITRLKQYGCAVGLSDHSRAPLVAELAVALGAAILEVHLTLPVPPAVAPLDAAHSLDPQEFREMVLGVRMAELALGEARLGVRDGEAATDSFARRWTYAYDYPLGTAVGGVQMRALRAPVGVIADREPWPEGLRLLRAVRATDPVMREDFTPRSTD